MTVSRSAGVLLATALVMPALQADAASAPSPLNLVLGQNFDVLVNDVVGNLDGQGFDGTQQVYQAGTNGPSSAGRLSVVGSAASIIVPAFSGTPDAIFFDQNPLDNIPVPVTFMLDAQHDVDGSGRVIFAQFSIEGLITQDFIDAAGLNGVLSPGQQTLIASNGPNVSTLSQATDTLDFGYDPQNGTLEYLFSDLTGSLADEVGDDLGIIISNTALQESPPNASPNPFIQDFNFAGFGDFNVGFTAADVGPSVGPRPGVPVPHALPLILTGVLGIGVVKYARRRKKSDTATPVKDAA